MSADRPVSALSALKPSLLKSKMADESPQPAEEDYSFKGEQDQQPTSREQTPSKKESLREAIISRVSASKNSKKSKQVRRDEGNITEEFVVYEDLRQTVITHQNSNSEGYYSYSDWLKINEQLFGQNSSLAPQLWKILRIVNFGEVSIPTGLIYEVLAILKAKGQPSEKERQLVAAINNFLEVNQMRSNFYTLKELNNYKPLSTIIRGYDSGVLPEETRSASRKPDAKIFEELYLDAKARSEKKTMRCITSQQQQLKDCTFVPYVSNYPLQEQSTERSNHSKRCASACKYRRKQEPEVVMTSQKARPIDPKLFETPPVASIWGVEEHIRRTVGSYNEKLRVKRMIEKPVVLKLTS